MSSSDNQPSSPYGVSDLTYNDYLKVPELLSLQQLLSQPPHHDEMLFIVIHQTYELWFRLILHELEKSIKLMRAQHVLQAHHFLHRVVTIMRLLVQQIHVLETMTAADFLKFRDRLEPASGFQSLQFREIEFIVGVRDARYIDNFAQREREKSALERRLREPSLRDAYYDLLRTSDFDIPADISTAALEQDEAARTRLLEALKQIYQDPIEQAPLYMLSESLVDLDQLLSLWRYHHVLVVERIIGNRRGTGGSSGAAYLRTTLEKRAFPYLWQVRTWLEA